MPAVIDTTSANGITPAESKADRTRGFDMDRFPTPTGREEDWRFTPLSPLVPLLDGDGGATIEPEFSGVGATLTADVIATDPLLVPADRTSAVTVANTELFVVTVPPETTDGRVDLVLTGTGGVAYSRIRVDIGRHAQTVVVLDHRGTATIGTTVEIAVGDGAKATVVTIHDWDDTAVHAAAHAIRVGRDAHVEHLVATFGGALVRTTVDVEYAGPGGNAKCFGVFFADGGQHLEHRLFVDHAVPNCTSYVEYRGALRGDPTDGDAGIARTVWVGDVLIRKAATGTSTYELNRNLLLTDAARADSVPNLEIETGDVIGAGHASTTGRFDDEQLFYLQSRGIPEDLARRLVVRGFFADLLSRIAVPDIVERIDATLERELGGASE